MAIVVQTVRTYALDGSTRDFTVPFEYLARKFVQVSLLGPAGRKPMVLNSEFRFTTKNSISLLQPWGPTQGYDRIEIRRHTSSTDRLVDFSDGSILRAVDLNVSQIQAIHIAEEARDAALLAIPQDDEGNLDAKNRRIVNLADGVGNYDAVNKKQLVETLGEAGGVLSDVREAQKEVYDYIEKFSNDAALVRGVSWVYNNGSANGGERAIKIDRATKVFAVPYIEVNGLRQEVGYHFEFDGASQSITLSEPLAAGDFLMAMTTESTIPLEDMLHSSIGAASIGTRGGGTVQDAIDIVTGSTGSVIFATNHGVVDTEGVDSSDALQALIDKSGRTPIVLPATISISKPIVYRSRTCIVGHPESFTQVKLMANFEGDSAFVPINTAQTGTDSAILVGLNIVDLAAKNVGRGCDSTHNGIDVTGSFNMTLRNITGVRLNNTVFSAPGTEVQHTRRLRIDSLNGSNVNRHIYMTGDGTGRFSYGDIYVNDFKTSASCALPSVIEDTDGLQVIGAVIFPNGGLRISGNYLNITGAHLFEPKAPLGSGEIPAGIHVSKRSDTLYSEYVTIAGTSIAFAGRLADTTSGNPAQSNEGAPGLLMERVRVFNVQVNINHSSKESVKLVKCLNGTMNIASREANTQALGSGKLPAGTYDSLRMESCSEVTIHMSDTSSSRRNAVSMDDKCVGCVVTGAASRGATLGVNVDIPRSTANRVIMSFDGQDEVRSQVDTTPPSPNFVGAPAGETSPSVTGGVNNVYVSFTNSTVVNVTDLPDVPSRREVTINLNDNNATRLVSTKNGGKFRTLTGANLSGRGTFARFIRDPATGDLVQI